MLLTIPVGVKESVSDGALSASELLLTAVENPESVGADEKVYR